MSPDAEGTQYAEDPTRRVSRLVGYSASSVRTCGAPECGAPAVTTLDVPTPDGKAVAVAFCGACAAFIQADVTVIDTGTVWTFTVHTRAAREWIDRRVDIPGWAGATRLFHAEWRAARDILEGMEDAGFKTFRRVRQ